MAIGVAGSTLCSELNRLANAGVYPPLTEYLGEAGAANKWAETTGLSLIGALNIKAGITDKKLYQGLNKVCNTLAGTVGLEALVALRSMPGAVVYAIGATGPGGGKVFYDAGSAQSWGRYLEIGTGTGAPFAWSGNTTTLVGTSMTIGSGLANTNAAVAQNNTANKAITWTRAHRGGGFDDWFLPSIGDIEQMWANRNAIGGFPWSISSSSEFSATNLYWFDDYAEMVQTNRTKASPLFVRPVRAFN